ncbi:hypothetical protein ACFYKX_10920 [Cytobacillus sp. FJAT-54145]|uniref:PI-PLC Y-box domain-containing protein n=1 Tax=Cytobacillus spartinae TaxID=3299023 RepID=A0ABW6KBZ7_9BACI
MKRLSALKNQFFPPAAFSHLILGVIFLGVAYMPVFNTTARMSFLLLTFIAFSMYMHHMMLKKAYETGKKIQQALQTPPALWEMVDATVSLEQSNTYAPDYVNVSAFFSQGGNVRCETFLLPEKEVLKDLHLGSMELRLFLVENVIVKVERKRY